MKKTTKRKPAGFPIPDAAHMTASAVAKIFGIRRQSFAAWKGLPRNPDGTFDLAAVVQWRVESLTEQLRARAPEPESSALERYREARARRAELEVGQLQDSLVDKADVEARWGRVLSHLVQSFDGMGKVLAPRLAMRHEKEIAQTVRDEVRHTIETARAAMLADEDL
jgi:hypothetical protein